MLSIITSIVTTSTVIFICKVQTILKGINLPCRYPPDISQYIFFPSPSEVLLPLIGNSTHSVLLFNIILLYKLQWLPLNDKNNKKF